MLKKDVSIASFPRGIDVLADETSMPKGSARDMVNVDVSDDGGFGRREGFTRLSSLTGAHSLWGSMDGSFGLYARDGLLKRMVVQGGTPLSATVLSGLAPGATLSYFERADEVFFSNGQQLGVVTRSSARFIGMDTPPAPALSALSVGGLAAGRYSVALSYLLASGEESGLSAMTTIGATAGVRAALPVPAGVDRIRIYSTSANGDVLYQVAEVPTGLAAYDMLDLPMTKVADNQHLRRMPAGHIVRVFRGRLVTAVDDQVWFSEPFRFGLTSPRHGFVRFNDRVLMVEPVEGGLYVGTKDCVYFLDGGGPHQFQQRVASSNAAAERTSTLVAGGRLPGKLAEQGADYAAVWLGRAGYSIGMPDGTVHDIHSARLDLSKIEGATGAVSFTSDGISQVLSIVESTELLSPGAAVDSEI